MKKILAFIVLIFICNSLPMQAQTIKILNSTMQSWSGGIAGMSGCNYTFSIEFSDYKKELLPDTLWIGQKPIQILISDTGYIQANTKRIVGKKSVRFEINARTSTDEYMDRYPNPGNEPKQQKASSPVPYKGVALLSYQYNGKPHYYTISKILKVYPPVSYP